MANGYGYSGSSGSSSPSRSSSSTRQSTTNTQGKVAPPGFHYMPDGSLMSDVEHAKIYGKKPQKTINSFDLDLSDASASGEARSFNIIGDKGAEFILEIKNEDNYYYNFVTNAFQVAAVRLEKVIESNIYSGSIALPSVGDNDQYDIYLYAVPGTVHANYEEVRFRDGSVDINSSIGSNSLMMQKVIYQYTDLTLTLSPFSPNNVTDLIKTSTRVDDTITVSRGKNTSKIPFTISCAVNADTKCYQIRRQPTSKDIVAFKSLTVGSAPEILPEENEYPAISNTDTVDGDFTSGTGLPVKIVMDTNVADKMVVGDRVTVETASLSNTVDGATSNSNRIVFDNNANTRTSVGDRLFRSNNTDMQTTMEESEIIVTHIDPDGDNNKEIQVGRSLSCADGANISFKPKVNYVTTTVAALNPDDDNAKEFSLDQTSCGFVDGTTLSFSSRKNFQWPLDNVEGLQEGMIVLPATNVATRTTISSYIDKITLFEGAEEEKTIVKAKAKGINTKNQTPTVTNGVVTTQTGNVIFNQQQVLALAGDTIRVGGYGENKINSLCGYDVRFADLKIELNEITTTTTAACINSTSVVVASRNGILDSVSEVSGIGIDSNVVNPTVASGAGTVSGAGTIVLSAAQNLESGITLTFANAGQTATITGNIEILKAGTADQTLRFDMENLLSIT